MTLSRLLPIQMHAVFEMAFAPVVMIAPFALGLAPVSLIAALALDGLLIGSALHASAGSPRISAHRQIDSLVIALAVGFGLGSALSGELAAAGLFAGLAAFEGLLSASTRYSGERGRHT